MDSQKIRIGIFGSGLYTTEEIAAKTRQLGESLSGENVILITGACTGLPYEVVSAAYKKNKTEIWGFSPSQNYEDQCLATPDDDNSLYVKLLYVPKDFPFAQDVKVAQKYRNVLSTANCDGGIIISGRWGSLNEFTNLYDMGKVIGVLTETGGIADMLSDLNEKINKPGKAVVLFASSPDMLVTQVIEEIKKRKK